MPWRENQKPQENPLPSIGFNQFSYSGPLYPENNSFLILGYLLFLESGHPNGGNCVNTEATGESS